MKVNFKLLQLLSSKICHDLIGPVGSITFSMDMISEEGNIENKETFDIAQSSVQSLVVTLDYFRMALGASVIGTGESAVHKVKEQIKLLFDKKKLNIYWEDGFDESLVKVSTSDNLKLFLNILLMIYYAVHKSADISIYYRRLKNGMGIAIAVRGGVKLGIDNIQALRLEIKDEDLTPRNVQSYFTAILADYNNAGLEVRETKQNEIQIAFKLFSFS